MKLDIRKFEILLAEKQMTLTKISELSGLTWNGMREINREKRPATIGKLAKALGVDVTDIIED